MHKKMPRVEIPHGVFLRLGVRGVRGVMQPAVPGLRGLAGGCSLAVQPARLALARAVFQDGVVGHQLARLVPLLAGRKARASPGIGG